jgi:hypothetical protein
METEHALNTRLEINVAGCSDILSKNLLITYRSLEANFLHICKVYVLTFRRVTGSRSLIQLAYHNYDCCSQPSQLFSVMQIHTGGQYAVCCNCAVPINTLLFSTLHKIQTQGLSSWCSLLIGPSRYRHARLRDADCSITGPTAKLSAITHACRSYEILCT